jgi:hypothetical protein
MFGWDSGEIWVVTVTHRSLLDWVSAALFHLGAIVVLVRYAKWRRWQDLFLLLSIPILMLPSTLALAFPSENPAPNRASGAMVPAFTLAGVFLAVIPRWGRRVMRGKWGRAGALGLSVILFGLALLGNYDLVFEDYAEQMRNSLWNSREMGGVIRGFATSIGEYENTRVMRFAHWVDVRLVYIAAGLPGADFGVKAEDLDRFAEETKPQLYLLNVGDDEGLAGLREVFPDGRLERVVSKTSPGRDFLVYFVPGEAPDDEVIIEPE